MSRLTHLLVVTLASVLSASSSAALMSPVVIDGRAWLQPAEFTGHSWQQIAQVCDPSSGHCDGSLGGRDITGMKWASLEDISQLYANVLPSYWPGGSTSVSMFSNPTLPEFNNFFDTFGFVPVEALSTPLGSVRQVFAYTADNENIETVFQATNYFAENIYLASNDGTFQTVNRGHDVGAWIYNEVPAPATLPLLGMGLWALAWSRRKPSGN